jgi:hypothetical protein
VARMAFWMVYIIPETVVREPTTTRDGLAGEE